MGLEPRRAFLPRRALAAGLLVSNSHKHTQQQQQRQRGDDWLACPLLLIQRKNTHEEEEWGEGEHVGKLVQVLGAHAVARSMAFKAPLNLLFLVTGALKGFVCTLITLVLLKDIFLESIFSILEND